jgi:hypothetical protein
LANRNFNLTIKSRILV